MAKKLKVHSLIDKVYRRLNLHIAFEKVKQNKGAAGVDEVSLQDFESKLDFNLEEIHRLLYEDKYRPQPVRRVFIPKPDGDERPLGIPTVKDRVVQQALLNRMEKIFEAKFLDCSFGYRPNRNQHAAIQRVEQYLKEGSQWVVEVDIAKFFDTVNHQKLINLVAEEISDGRVLKLIGTILESGVKEKGCIQPTVKGVPQGGVISPLLANIYLHPFDEAMTKFGCKMVRYADDVVILCNTKEEAQAVVLKAKTILEGVLGLKLNTDKTKIVHKSQGFEFLGYFFGSGHSDYKMPRPKAVEAFMDKVRYYTRRKQPLAFNEMIVRLNPVILGWGRYFMHGHSKRIFWYLDCWIRDRVRAYRLRKWNNAACNKISGYSLRKMGLATLYELLANKALRAAP